MCVKQNKAKQSNLKGKYLVIGTSSITPIHTWTNGYTNGYNGLSFNTEFLFNLVKFKK